MKMHPVMTTTPPLSAALASLRARITRVFPAQVREAVSKLTDDQLWWRPNEESNSVGNLVLHLSGSLNLYLNHNLGGIPYERDRAQEFAERRHIPREELLAVFDGMVANAEKTFDGLTEERLGEPSQEPKMNEVVIEDLINVGVHFSRMPARSSGSPRCSAAAASTRSGCAPTARAVGGGGRTHRPCASRFTAQAESAATSAGAWPRRARRSRSPPPRRRTGGASRAARASTPARAA